MRSRRLVRLAAIGVTCFFVLQLYQPNLDAPATRAEVAMPAGVEAVLRNGCYDCHSNETQLLWFDRIAPASWLVARDVRGGRAALNFSELGRRPKPEQRAKLFEAIEMIASSTMPPAPYKALHGRAVVSPSDLETLKVFATTLAEPVHEPLVTKVSLEVLAKPAPAAPNGLVFPTDVASWTPVEVSERWDNGTIRLVVANATALEAVKGNRANPFPDGACLAKVAWKEGGAFVQVELMKKEGASWSWARWLGNDLAPYGRDASSTDECRNCHEPMRARDFVYSLPEGSFDPAWGKLTAVQVERDRFRISASRTVVWSKREDPNWFGARISTGKPVVEDSTTSN